MRKFIALILTVLFVSCQSAKEKRETKAQELIKLYLNQALDDPSSYDPVNFGTLDSVTESALSSENRAKIKHGELSPDTDNRKGFYGYTLRHEYRAKNKFGALVKTSKRFYFDKELTKVDGAY